LFAELRDLMGRGEAACLALAKTTGSYIASDEKKRFRRCAVDLIGAGRILRTESLLLEAIRQGLITVKAADRLKKKLEESRYSMPFASFADLL
jgi:predicted nucleic acid-binding protein